MTGGMVIREGPPDVAARRLFSVWRTLATAAATSVARATHCRHCRDGGNLMLEILPARASPTYHCGRTGGVGPAAPIEQWVRAAGGTFASPDLVQDRTGWKTGAAAAARWVPGRRDAAPGMTAVGG